MGMGVIGAPLPSTALGSKSVLRRYPRDVRVTPASGPPRVIAIRLKIARSSLLQAQASLQSRLNVVALPSSKTAQNHAAILGKVIQPDRFVRCLFRHSLQTFEPQN